MTGGVDVAARGLAEMRPRGARGLDGGVWWWGGRQGTDRGLYLSLQPMPRTSPASLTSANLPSTSTSTSAAPYYFCLLSSPHRRCSPSSSWTGGASSA